jgi:ribonuclease HI
VKLVVHVDGGSRGNPGPAAAAAVLSTPGGEVVDEAARTLGSTTNNVAEYRGLLRALGGFERWSIRPVPRAQNADADALVNQALDGELA